MTFGEKVLTFYKNLKIKSKLPENVTVLNPFHDSITNDLCALFYRKYYDDDKPRKIIFGINPGRHGGGLTGIPFTDPIKLETVCEIPNSLPKKSELSAEFIYQMISKYGGAQHFYSQFFISAVSPLGFTQEGKNLNYYDSKVLEVNLRSFIIECINEQLSFNINRDVCYCLGEGENFKYLSRLNNEYKFFGKILPLPHPRFIMQYRRKMVNDFIDLYIDILNHS